MSVEEARGVVNAGINDLVYPGQVGDPWLRERLQSAIDHLILEVQAEMPCYEGEFEGDWHPNGRYFAFNSCPSCIARAQLKDLAPA